MEDPELYIRKSPFFKMDKVKSPVLIFHGTADNQVPPAQSWSFFRALQYYDKVPVKFVIFPGEPHGPRKLTHQMRKVEEEVAWFDKYFFKTAPAANEAVKKGSPLEDSLRHKSAKTAGMFYGEQLSSKAGATEKIVHDALIVPEVVDRNGLEIGRFELTEKQYGSCREKTVKYPKPMRRTDSSIHFPAKEDLNQNQPMHGIILEEAQAYITCLSKATGQTWRIPYEDEVKSLYEHRDGENTLDYWAGYAPNPEDAARLREAAKKLNATAPLLKEVGSFHGQGKDDEEPIYDLGGNVAEWVLTRDGKGKVIGGSADCPADAKANCTPAPEYVGFRVVRGEAKPAAKP
jgi:hypothetical protein